MTPRALLVAGSRSFHPRFDRGVPAGGWRVPKMFDVLDQASYALDQTFDEVIHGGARGVDVMAGQWAQQKGYPVRVFDADWAVHGRRAGYVRNQEMVNTCTAGIVVWDGESKGTRHTIDLLITSNKPFVLVVRDSQTEGEQ